MTNRHRHLLGQAMIDIATETVINLKDAAKRFPSSRGGRPTHIATVFRLIMSRKLEGIRMGGRWVTSVEGIQRYVERETSRALGIRTGNESTIQTSTRRERELARVDSELAAAGF